MRWKVSPSSKPSPVSFVKFSTVFGASSSNNSNVIVPSVVCIVAVDIRLLCRSGGVSVGHDSEPDPAAVIAAVNCRVPAVKTTGERGRRARLARHALEAQRLRLAGSDLGAVERLDHAL